MSIAGATAGDVGAAAREGRPGEHDQRPAQRLLGAVAAYGRMGGSTPGTRDGRGVVRAGTAGDGAKAARPGQTSHRLPACDRLAGAQTWSVRPLLLPGRTVSHEPVSPGLRRVDADAVGARGQPGIPGDFAAGGAGQRERRRWSAGPTVGPGRHDQRGGGGSAAT